MNNHLSTYDIAVTVKVTATSREEAERLAYDRLLCPGSESTDDDTPDPNQSQASLNDAFEFDNQPKANLDALFDWEDDTNAA
jgi:hypothetical protein